MTTRSSSHMPPVFVVSISNGYMYMRADVVARMTNDRKSTAVEAERS